MTTASPLMGSEPLLSDPRFCRSMRTFRKLRKMCQHPDDDLFVIFKEVLDSRTRLEHRLRDVEEKVGAAAAYRTQPSATSPRVSHPALPALYSSRRWTPSSSTTSPR